MSLAFVSSEGEALIRARPCLAELRRAQAAALGPPGEEDPLAMGVLEAYYEAGPRLADLFRSTASYFAVAPSGTPQLPASTPLTPASSCCQEPDHRCPGDPTAWDRSPWQELSFAISGPHLLQYQVSSTDRTFVLRAVGEPGCTGRTIRFERSGTVTPDLNIQGSREMSVTLDGEGPSMVHVVADLVERYARQVCAAPDGAILDEAMIEAIGPYGHLIDGYLAVTLDDLLSGERPPAGPLETRILEAYERGSLCWTDLAVGRLVSSF